MNYFKSIGSFLLTVVIMLSVQSIVASNNDDILRERYRKAGSKQERYEIASDFLTNVKNAQELLAFYHPTPDRCRAGIQNQEVATSDVLTIGADRTLGGSLACLIAGYKPIAWIEDFIVSGTEKYLSETGGSRTNAMAFNYLPDAVKRLFKDNNIAAITWGSGAEVLLYSPQGRENALLFIKVQKNRIRPKAEYAHVTNEYIVGHLLGYTDEDIQAYYQHPVKLMKKLSPLQIEERLKKRNDIFAGHKQEALAWIKENRPDIEEWAATQSDIKILPIEFSSNLLEEAEKKQKESVSSSWSPDADDSL